MLLKKDNAPFDTTGSLIFKETNKAIPEENK